MSEALPACILKYLVKGVAPNRESQSALQTELYDLLPSVQAVTVLPVVEGFSVEMEFSDLSPFTRNSFEPYVADHILPEAVASRCEVTEVIALQLLKARYP
jgi:hypothetical protein